LEGFSYEVLYAPRDGFFLTSDSPVFTLREDGDKQASAGMGFGWPGVVVYFPLNKRACLRMRASGREPRNVELREDALAQINRVTMANASRFLYSPEGYRKIARQFDQWGCKIKPGHNAFMATPDLPK